MDISKEQQENAENKYIVFLLGSELYGAPILSVREVIEFKTPKPLPDSSSMVEGVINIRGEVIGAIDLRKRFGIQAKSPLCQLIFESEGGLLAATVDRVESVVVLNNLEEVGKKNIQSLQNSHFLIGVGQLGDRLINIIDLGKVLTH